MPVKIKVTGPVKKVRTVKSPLDKKVNWNMLEITTGGSPAAPKGLPLASAKVNYTVLLNDKQYKKLKSELEEFNLPLIGAKMFVEGEITLDQPLSIVEGEIGVIAYQFHCIDAQKLKNEREKEQEEKQEEQKEEVN